MREREREKLWSCPRLLVAGSLHVSLYSGALNTVMCSTPRDCSWDVQLHGRSRWQPDNDGSLTRLKVGRCCGLRLSDGESHVRWFYLWKGRRHHAHESRRLTGVHAYLWNQLERVLPYGSTPGMLEKESHSRRTGVPWTFASRDVPLFVPRRGGSYMYRRPRK